MPALAQHTLLEMHECDPARLRETEALRPLVLEAIRASGGTIVTEIFHNFSPYGVSGVVVIAESHVAIHTWPEHGYAAVDVFSCSAKLDHERIGRLIAAAVVSQRQSVRTVARGEAEKCQSDADTPHSNASGAGGGA
jgi:S-adenosylmethionine decarboxylase proenzyme